MPGPGRPPFAGTTRSQGEQRLFSLLNHFVAHTVTVVSLFRIRSFFTYWLEAVDEHSLHSPFFFDLYTSQIKPRAVAGKYDRIETLRKKLLVDERVIPVRDLGTGATRRKQRKISAIARTSLSMPRYSNVFCRLIDHFEARCIVELGTSFGINTLYLAEKPEVRVATFEGAPAIADIAGLTFEFASKKNIDLIVGNIDKTLPAFLARTRRVDFAFLDANHSYDPTLKYFEWLLKKVHEKTVLIVDDIHHSHEMERAWKAIRNHRLVYGSVDLFRCGIVFFDPSLNKQHVILQF
jgi:predicted O-methyltransferase YrrM